MTVDISRSKTASGTASGNFTTISTPILPHNHSKACFVQDMPHETPDEFKDEAASLISPKIVSDNSILPQEVQLPAPELKESETETSDTSSRRALWNTPFEIWHEIFQYLIPPTTFLDSSLCRGPRSPWSLALCTKKILISVCKTWYNVGIHLLYQQIVLRRFPQIHSLLQSLDLNSELGPMIMDITVSCFVSSDYSPVIKSELSRLLKYCPLVSHFTFAIEPPTPLELYPPSEFLATATHMLSNITHIEFGPNVAFSDVVPHLTHCKSLISLTFDMHGQTCGNMATEAVDLPMLETLQISWHSQKRAEVDVLIVVASWSMPRLHRFTAHQTEFFVDITELYYSPFWKKYGPALSTLCVVVSRFVLWGPILGTPFNQSLLDFCPIPGTSFVQSLLKLCPNLEHLAISSPMLAEILSHKTLKWIDIWATTYRQTYERRLSAPSEVVDFMKAQDFPMLRGVRILEWALFDTTGPALHLRVPPNMIEGAESIEWLFPGVHVQHDPGHLYRRDLDICRATFRLSKPTNKVIPLTVMVKAQIRMTTGAATTSVTATPTPKTVRSVRSHPHIPMMTQNGNRIARKIENCPLHKAGPGYIEFRKRRDVMDCVGIARRETTRHNNKLACGEREGDCDANEPDCMIS